MARVAVILTSYNRPRMVQASIKSVLAQNWGDFTLYIMDDNSVEQVKQILRGYTKDARVRLYFSDVKNEDRLKTCRYAVQINKALRMSQEPLITYLTDDAGMYPNKLHDMVRWLDQHPGADVCYGYQRVLENGKVACERANFGVVDQPGCLLDHNQIMFRRHILEKIGYWSEDASHMCTKDADWFNTVARHGYKFYPINSWTDWLIYHPKRITQLAMERRLVDILTGCLME